MANFVIEKTGFIFDLDGQKARFDEAEEFSELRSADAVCAIEAERLVVLGRIHILNLKMIK